MIQWHLRCHHRQISNLPQSSLVHLIWKKAKMKILFLLKNPKNNNVKIRTFWKGHKNFQPASVIFSISYLQIRTVLILLNNHQLKRFQIQDIKLQISFYPLDSQKTKLCTKKPSANFQPSSVIFSSSQERVLNWSGPYFTWCIWTHALEITDGLSSFRSAEKIRNTL